MATKWTENNAVLATIDPDAYTAAAYNTDVIDMRYWDTVVFVVMVGTLGASATVDFVVNYDTASGGSYASAVTGKSITQLTQAGTDDDKQVIVEVSAAELAAEGINARYLRGTLTVGTATSDAGLIAIGSRARYQPADDFDLASVDEIVS